jgi:hypothetical protein
MGLTIHYSLKSTTKSADKARKLVERMRQLAMDLPFESVGPILDLSDETTDFIRRQVETLPCPWNQLSIEVYPTRVIAFHVGPELNIGLAQFPSEIEWEYEPEDDQQFQYRHEFSERKFREWIEKKYSDLSWVSPSDFYETRTIKTRLGWRWRMTHASCHVSVLLERIGELPTLKLDICDDTRSLK